MANYLSVAKVHSILTLHERGYSQRRIARMLGVDRQTVSRYVGGASNPASEAPTGSAGPPGSPVPESRPATDGRLADAARGDVTPVKTASSAGRATPGRAGLETSRDAATKSDCQPYLDEILPGLARGLSAVRIHQDLVAAHGVEAAPSYHSVRRFVGRLRRSRPLPFRRMECDPGAEAQVDFGTGAPVVQPDSGASGASGASGGGRKRRTHVLRIVLSHSRKAYSEVVYRQTTDAFIGCLENAFRHFGGVPQTLVLDNLKAAVTRADWFDPEINPKVQSFCAHYGIVPLPTKPRTPRHKGKVERGIDYVKNNALKGRVFTSLQEQNEHLSQWEATIAGTRIHGTTKKQVNEHFDQVEKPALGPLAAARFPYFQEGRRVVSRDGHIEVAKAYYSAPAEYLGRRLWVRWDAHMVRIFDGRMRPIAVHARKEEGRFSTQDQHIHPQKINGIERGAAWLLHKAERIGTQAGRWSEAMLKARGIEGIRVLQGLVALTHKHDEPSIDRACEIALSHGAFRLRTIRTLIRRDVGRSARQDTLPGLAPGADFIDEHPIIRSLAEYGQLARRAITQPV